MIPRGPVFDTKHPDSPKFREGWQTGKVGVETDKKLGDEINAVIDEIEEMTPPKMKAKG
jgi:hypothetical protein